MLKIESIREEKDKYVIQKVKEKYEFTPKWKRIMVKKFLKNH